MSSTNSGTPTSESLRFIEELWRSRESSTLSLPVEWRTFFDEWQFEQSAVQQTVPPLRPLPGVRDKATSAPADAPASPDLLGSSDRIEPDQVEPHASVSQPAQRSRRRGINARITRLIGAYRAWGHLAAQLDPLGRPRPAAPQLTLEVHGLSTADLQQPVSSMGQTSRVTLAELLEQLRSAYCGNVGYQYQHLEDPAARNWLQRRIERSTVRFPSRRSQRRILSRLIAATEFELFTRRKYVGAKTFSLAGSESLVPLMDTLVERASNRGVFAIVMGMAHRGRLNLLVNILGQPLREIFREFEDQEAGQRAMMSGDVRYHLGYSTDWLSQDGDRVHVSLSFNPSHLEFVNPVALGRVRAKQQRLGDHTRERGMTVLLHGDASFIGEGVVQESLNLASLPGYTTGGTVHVVIDNQLGFTTDPNEARSTTYSSDIALAFGAPVIHVNGDDPEAAVRAAALAVDYRQTFHRDVVLNLHCFRRWGHNESDEPSFTQPLMYRIVESHPTVTEMYEQQLRENGRASHDLGDRLRSRYRARLQAGLEAAGRTRNSPRIASLGGVWSGFVGGPEPEDDQPTTSVPSPRLKEWLTKLITVPDGFHLHSKLSQGLARRHEMARGERPLDWATCETLALASLLMEGRPVRFTGQDTARGTFSQRHAVWHDVETGATYLPLAHLSATQAAIEIINSPLCETGCLGFEYGFSLDYPEALVAWEAQFGDFWNAAQVIFDQFLASAEDKWARLSGLVLLLPHGFEGQGPEHSSARLERFLVSAANNNYQVVVPSTPAQYFHCLRRQVLRRWRKPLVILTPKSLLRHHEVVSSWSELEDGHFQPVLADPHTSHTSCRRVLMCMGKFYYDLAREKSERGHDDVTLLRLEQFYPLPLQPLEAAMARVPRDTQIFWCQEEPANMGAWRYLQSVWPMIAPNRPPLLVVSRPESASPATGSHAAHRYEQQSLIAQAFAQ